MQFASLTSLWFALTLPIILIMYLFKRKYSDTDISSHLLWQRVLKEMEANRPWQKLRSNLLLFLQLLVASLLVLALMQPFIWTKETDKAHVVIIIDQSASMASYLVSSGDVSALGEPVTRLEEAKQRVLTFIRKQARNQQITLIGMGSQADVLFTRETNIGQMEQIVKTIDVHYGRTAYKETMSLAASLTRQDEAEIYLFTDGQLTESLQGLSFQAALNVELIETEDAHNVSIVQFGVKRNTAVIETVSAVASFKNWGNTALTFAAVLHVEDEHHHVHTESLQPGQQKAVYMNDLPLASYYRLVIDTDDVLMADNESYAFLADGQPKRALLLSEGNIFLEMALRLSDVVVLKAQKDTQGLMVLPDSEFDFIVVDAVQPETLATEAWQSLLKERPVWYLSYNFTEHRMVQASTDYTIDDHPLTQHVQFQDTHIAEVQVFDRLGWGEAVASVGGLPLIYAGTFNGYPHALFTFDLQRSDLPLRAEFPVLVQNTVNWLSSDQAQSLGNVIAGETLDIALATTTSQAKWSLISSRNEVFEVNTVGDAVSHVQPAPPLPGLYYFVEQNERGDNSQERLLHVMMDPRESNVTQQSLFETDMIAQVESEMNGTQQSETQQGVTSSSLVPWIVMCLLGLIVLEWGVYRRGSAF